MPATFPEEAKNFRLLGHDASAAWGGGSLVQVHKGHAYVGAVGGSSFNGPEGFTVHDVRDPTQAEKGRRIPRAARHHCHKLRIVGDDLLYVNSERLAGDKGKNARAGFFIFDVSKPSAPKPIGFYDMPGSGPHRFGVDLKRGLAFMPSDAPGWAKRVIWTLDIKDPLKPEVVSIWGLPWMKTDSTKSATIRCRARTPSRLHGPPMIRGNRMYCAWWGGGMSIIDCTDLRDMKLVGHVKWSPPFPGSTHTCWPIGDRPYLIVTDEARGKEKFWDAQFMWIIDARDGDEPAAGRDLHAGARKILRPPRPLRRAQHPGGPSRRRAVEGHRVPHLLQRRPARGRMSAIRCIRRKSAATCRKRRKARQASSQTTSAPTTRAGFI